jgi:eukaryotic-like serine/threonine-protein kinase
VTTPPVHLVDALRDRYVLERELGQGGMARVYLAEDLKHGRRVALKLLRPDLAAMIGVDRFLAEIRTMAGLQHPRILPLFDSGLVRLPADDVGPGTSLPYYVMPYVAGETLRARLTRERQLPVAEALSIAIQVAGALDHAHREGIIHRDIKPENILLQDGEAVVADFGIALALGAAAGERLTEIGLTLGTPVYMSPEQALGDRAIDGRSDLFSLGCVLYEMLAGEPPHTGASPQVITAKRLSQAVPSVRVIRETVPPAVDAALVRVLAKAPADRFATGREFAAALDAPVDSTQPTVLVRSHPRWRMQVAGVLGFMLLGAGTWFMRSRHTPAPGLDPERLAVAPFDVTGPGLEVWREGVVDLLARTLDGAGNLRTVSPSVVLHGWAGRSDRASALVLGRRTGAGVVATGELSQLAADRVRLRATLLDVRDDELLGEVEVEGPAAALGVLADSLGLGILRTLSRTRPVAAVRQAAIASAPLGALKAFLAGEQAYRRGSYDSALVAYQEALTRDSTFTLAMYRMGQVLGWHPPSAAAYLPADDYRRQAIQRNHGLSARDSLLISADSLSLAAEDQHPEYYAPSLALRQEAVRRFPADPEAWLALGELRYHAPFGLGQNLPEAFDAFERAIELDPGFGPAYEHVIALAVTIGREDRAAYYARAAAELRATTAYSASVRLASRLLLLPEAERPEALAAALDSVPAGALYEAGMMFLRVPDTHETAVQLLRRLARRQLRSGEAVEWVVDSLMRTRYVAEALVRRGHLREALSVDRADLVAERVGVWWYSWLDPFSTLAFLGAIPAADAARTFAPALEPGITVTDGYERRWQGLRWWAGQRDTASLALFQRRMQEAAARSVRADDVRRAQYFEGAARGYLDMVRGDTTEATRHFGALSDSVYCELVSCTQQKLVEAELLEARGAHKEAAAILDRWIPQIIGGLADVGLAERGRIAERLGDLATARRDYQHVADDWGHADPELAGYVAEAKAGLARVSRKTR